MVEAGTHLGVGSVYIKTGFENPTQPPAPPPAKILGPFGYVIKLSGLDCSRTRKEHIRSCRGITSTIIAAFILFILLYKVGRLMDVTYQIFEISWAESSVYAFMSLLMFQAAVCLVCWTRANFVSEFEEGLSRVRQLRLSNNQNIDDYKKFHRKAAIMIIPIFFVILTTSIAASVDMRYYKHDNSTFSSTSPVFLIAPIIDIFGCLATSLSLVLFVTINISLAREVKHFNKELTNSARFQQLTLPNVLNSYSKRHSDIIQLVKFANGHLSKFGSIVPCFSLIAFVNATYLLSNFSTTMERLYFCLMAGWALISLGITVATMQSAVKIQDQIQETAEILMHDDVLQTCGDDQMHHTYRVTLDRCIYSNSKISLLNAFPIDSLNFNRIMFIFPNITFLMTMYHKTLMIPNDH